MFSEVGLLEFGGPYGAQPRLIRFPRLRFNKQTLTFKILNGEGG